MSRAAVRYAQAILDLAKEQKSVEGVFTEMQQIQKTVANSKELKDVLGSPLIKVEQKIASLKAVFQNVGAISLGLFDTLASNKRLSILDEVTLSFIELYEQDKGLEVAKVTTAVPLSGELETQILAKVKELTQGKEVTLKSIVDESIIGGFVLRIGDLQYNASVASQLSNLRRSFDDTSYVNKL